MPPKKKRGAGGARGRRGRPPQKKIQSPQSSPALDNFDSNETSSSNSPLLEEGTQPEAKVKLETKIHKKFGIKYHVPDEITTPKCQSPLADDITKVQMILTDDVSSSTTATIASNDVIESAEDSATDTPDNSTVDSKTQEHHVDDGMDVDSTSIEEGNLDDISQQMHQLEVGEDMEHYVVEETLEVQAMDSIVEYVNDGDVVTNEGEVVLTETDYVHLNDDTNEEVYYLMVESNEQDDVGSNPQINHISESELDEKEIVHIIQEPIDSKPDLPKEDSVAVNLQAMDTTNIEGPDKLNSTEQSHIKSPLIKTKDEKTKMPEKPSRKSRRIFEKEAKLMDADTSVEVLHEKRPENIENNETVTNSTNEVKLEVVETIENLDKKTEASNSDSETIPTSVKLSQSEISEEIGVDSSSQQTDEMKEKIESPKKIKKTKKSPTKPKRAKDVKEDKDAKDIKDSNDKDDKQKKNSKKQISWKVPSKIKKSIKSSSSSKPEDDDPNIRRSSRIKTISTQKVRSRGKGLVKKDDQIEGKSSNFATDDKGVFVAPTSTTDPEHKPVKVKSRWRRSSELEMRDTSKPSNATSDNHVIGKDAPKKSLEEEVERRLKQFLHLKENVYLTERISCKEAKKMTCDCFLTEDEIQQGEYGCGDDCLNRLLMIECGNLCTVGERCTNKRFQKMQSAPVEAFRTEKKGLGIRAITAIPSGEFILEYVGEVLDPDKFEQRANEYSKDKNQHYYFMSLRADAIIDATVKGNISRFINHSCEPNAETQKWTVNGELRIGFFSKRTILAGEEITFDYQFQRYGKEAQKCFCETPTCRGWLGEEPDDDDDEEEEDEDEDDDEEAEEEEVEEIVDKDKESSDSEVKKAITKKEVKAKKEKVPKPKKPKEPKQRLLRRKDRFEDIGIDDEIQSLQSTGLKNQSQTLKLSRLMVRAKEPVQRRKLLKLLTQGEFPCRRLFLDYHGLRLIHGWMTDAQHLAKINASMNTLRYEILQTLAVLPIPNKTMLQDSKVLSTVEKWSKKGTTESPVDSDSNSPTENNVCSKTELDPKGNTATGGNDNSPIDNLPEVSSSSNFILDLEPDKTENEDNEIRKSVGMEPMYAKVIPDYNVDSIKDELLIIFDDDFVPLELPAKLKKMLKPEKPKFDVLAAIVALALKLLTNWSSLKEVFRIPKKERIEQMKEHEREADRKDKSMNNVDQDTERRRDRYRQFHRPSRIETTDRLKERSKNDRSTVMTNSSHMSRLSKQERRELFARQVEQQDEEERRRKQQEMWTQHYKQCAAMGVDPRISNLPYVWNAQLNQWQTVPADPNYANYPIQPGMLPPNVSQPPIAQANMGTMPPMPNIPPQPYPEAEEDLSKVQFAGPIPPDVELPPKWKCAKDKYGRPYYYHVKFRKSQWEPPTMCSLEENEDEEVDDDDSETTSSSDTSSLSSSSSSDDSDSDDDTRLMLEIRNKFNKIDQQKKLAMAKKEEELHQPLITSDTTDEQLPLLVTGIVAPEDPILPDLGNVLTTDRSKTETLNEQDSPLEGQIAEPPPSKKRRVGLVQEHIISPRTEEDRLQFREDVKKYRQNKEIVRKQKETLMQQAKKHPKAPTLNDDKEKQENPKEKPQKRRPSSKERVRAMEAATGPEECKRIKETFRAAMASVMVSLLNPYRKPDCKEGRITSTDDFKHLARKLTHFVMVKELKFIDKFEDLQCTESVKQKAKEFVRKYMTKFNEVYQKSPVHEEKDDF